MWNNRFCRSVGQRFLGEVDGRVMKAGVNETHLFLSLFSRTVYYRDLVSVPSHHVDLIVVSLPPHPSSSLISHLSSSSLLFPSSLSSLPLLLLCLRCPSSLLPPLPPLSSSPGLGLTSQPNP